MNLANVLIKKLLDKDERENVRDALRKDSVIIPAILKILAGRMLECKPSVNMLKDVCYPYRRAAKDGAEIEIEWLIKLLTKDKE